MNLFVVNMWNSTDGVFRSGSLLLCLVFLLSVQVCAQQTEQATRENTVGSAERTFHSELDFVFSLQKYIEDGPPEMFLTPAFSYAYYAVPRSHNAVTNTEAARVVIPGSLLQCALTLGPYYDYGASHVTVDLSGAMMINATMALGGMLHFSMLRYGDQSILSDFSSDEVSAGPMFVAYPAEHLRLVLGVGYGSYTSTWRESFGGATDNTVRWVQVDHMLAAAGKTLGYEHALRLEFRSGGTIYLRFENIVEVPTASSISPGLHATFYGTFPEHDNSRFSLALGPVLTINSSSALRSSIEVSIFTGFRRIDPTSLGMQFRIAHRL